MIYATGDLHGNSLRFQPQYFPEQSEMTKDDYMIVCGDFGCVWNGDKSDDQQFDRLEALPFTVLFVDGNHENFDALSEYPVEQWRGGKVHKIRPHVIHLMRGQAFELQGRTFFTMGSAQSHDIADGILDMESSDFYGQYDSLCRNRGQFRINHISWWQEELPSDEEYAEAIQTGNRVKRFRAFVFRDTNHHTLRTDSDSAESQRRFQVGQADRLSGRNPMPQPVPLLVIRALPRQPDH